MIQTHSKYRSRQYYKSKGLYNAEETRFSMAKRDNKLDTKSIQKNIVAPFIKLLWTPLKLKLVNHLLHNQRLNLLDNCDFSQFRSKAL